MTNKPTYMKRIIAGSSLLFSILLATPQAYAQESVDVIIRENGTERREVIDLPKSMTYPVDSLLSDWKAKNYIDLGKDCSTSTVNPQFSDSVYIDRLSRIVVSLAGTGIFLLLQISVLLIADILYRFRGKLSK